MHVLCISISGSMYEENVIITPENVNVKNGWKMKTKEKMKLLSMIVI